ncbi:MAG: tetratricopeptide repeat protein [Deltaproteobacteria bacterium]|nr:tetratricopeptide repeat protein [Deltaproteobacteria bacterium]
MSRMLLAAALAALTSPIELEHQRSREAREHVAAREAEPALQAYQALEAEVGPRPEIEVGRGAALHAGGRDAEAAQAFERARQAPEPLGSRALLGLGTSLAGQGELDGAIAAYREALRRDPGFAEARQDLEVVLRRKVEQQQQQQHSKAEQRPQPSGQQGQRPEPRPAGEQGEKPQGEPQPQPGTPPPGERQAAPRQEQAAGEKPTRDEALRLLDAMRSREQNLPETARQRTARRGHAEKDW